MGVIGSGIVGQVLADDFLNHNHAVMRASREPEKLAGWKAKAGPNAAIGTFADASKFGDLVVLAAKGSAAESVLKLCGSENLAGKTVIDAMNPIEESPPVNGVLQFFTGPNESLMERLQKQVPKATRHAETRSRWWIRSPSLLEDRLWDVHGNEHVRHVHDLGNA